jgi:5,5'-dehydrodivanillate O-demethylase oxygenase subunit
VPASLCPRPIGDVPRLAPAVFAFLVAPRNTSIIKVLRRPVESARHLKIDFDLFEFGIFKRRLLEGDDESSDDWTVGHPILFPNTLAVGKTFQLRVPIDDTHTLHINYSTRPLAEGEAPQVEVPKVDLPDRYPDGTPILETILGQDMMAWTTPGAIAPRSAENLARSDRGIVMYRRMLEENIARVERGEEPMGLIRDPSRNEPMLTIAREHNHLKAMGYRSQGVTAHLVGSDRRA